MKSIFLNAEETYDGSQLVSLRNYLHHGLLGDSIVAWIGPCAVSLEHMVDGEDKLQGARICGDRMLHFIVETFDTSLLAAVGIQRLMTALAKDELERNAPEQGLARALIRSGDDIFAGERKLSISVATQSPTSSLIHFALNVTNSGTPVSTLSLEDLGVDPVSFARVLMQHICSEVTSIREATRKVRWVR
ncbi:MAG: DUF366 family protein [Bdellovibrionales bacterium]